MLPAASNTTAARRVPVRRTIAPVQGAASAALLLPPATTPPGTQLSSDIHEAVCDRAAHYITLLTSKRPFCASAHVWCRVPVRRTDGSDTIRSTLLNEKTMATTMATTPDGAHVISGSMRPFSAPSSSPAASSPLRGGGGRGCGIAPQLASVDLQIHSPGREDIHGAL